MNIKKKIKKLTEDNKTLNEKIEKLKKDNKLLKNMRNNNIIINNNNNNNNNEKLDENEKIKKLNETITELKFENNSLKDICSEVQNKNKELKLQINENKKNYIQDIDKLQSEIISFKENEFKEKNELEKKIKLLMDNNNSNNKDIINKEIFVLQKQVKELLQYKNKCNILEKDKFQLKSELRKLKQEKEKETIANNNYTKQIFKIAKEQSLIFESENNIIFFKSKENNSNINIKEEDKRENNETYIELNKRIGDLLKKNEDLIKENKKLENKRNELVKKVNNINDLIDLNNKDLVQKILELEKVIEVLNKELNSENNKKIVLQNEIVKLEKKINKQIDEASEKEEYSIKNTPNANNIIINNNNNNSPFVINDEYNDKIDNYKNQVSSLKNENYSLMDTINNLKNEIRLYKIKLYSSKKVNKDNQNQNIINNDDEDLIKDITTEMNRWKQEYYNLSKINDLLKEKILNLEKNLGIDEEIKYLKEVLYKKDKLLMDLTLQIKEFQSKSDDIILGKTEKNKEKQIEILLNEVKGIRKRLLNIVTSNDRINNFDDFINNIKIIQNCENKIKDKEAKKALEKLKLYIDEYTLNNDMAYNEFLAKLYSN